MRHGYFEIKVSASIDCSDYGLHNDKYTKFFPRIKFNFRALVTNFHLEWIRYDNLQKNLSSKYKIAVSNK